MSFSSGLAKLGHLFASIPSHIAAFFKTHAPEIQQDLTMAHTAIDTAVKVAQDVGEHPDIVGVLHDVGTGLTAASTAVTSEVNATTLSAQTAAVTALGVAVAGLLPVNDATKTAVADVSVKVNNVATTLEKLVPVAPVSSATPLSVPVG